MYFITWLQTLEIIIVFAFFICNGLVDSLRKYNKSYSFNHVVNSKQILF